MFKTTFYHSHPIKPENIPCFEKGSTLNDRVNKYVGNFFHNRLALFLHRVEQLHGLKVEKCVLKGSIVPVILQLSKEPSNGINDIDLQISFIKKTESQNPADQYIDTDTIRAVHKMSLDWLQLNSRHRTPLCRPQFGYSNVQVRNPSSRRTTPIDLSLNFLQPNAVTGPGAISTKDGMEIGVKYSSSGEIQFDVTQNPSISQFAPLAHSMGLYKQKLFTVTPEHMGQIRNGLLILLRYDIHKWNFVTKMDPTDPKSDLYEPGDIDGLKRVCFTSFLEQHKNDLDNMKLAQALQNFINNHCPGDAAQASQLLDKLLSLTLKYAEEPTSDLFVARKIVANMTSCAHYCQTLRTSHPGIQKLKMDLHASIHTINLIASKRADEPLSDEVKNEPEVVPLPPFNPELDIEEKEEEEKLQKTPVHHPLYDLSTLSDFVDKIDSRDDVSSEDKAGWLMHLLYKSCAEDCSINLNIKVETYINQLLKTLPKEIALDLSLAFINFIEQPFDLQNPSQNSLCSDLINQHLLTLLKQGAGKKGKQVKRLQLFYNTLPQAYKGDCLERLCTDYALSNYVALGEHKARLLLYWISGNAGMFSPSMLQLVKTCLKYIPDLDRAHYLKRFGHKLDEAMAVEPAKVEAPEQKAEPVAVSEEPIRDDSLDVKKINILLKHVKELKESKQWAKALKQLNEIELRLNLITLQPHNHKRVAMTLKREKNAIRETMIADMEKQVFSGSQELTTLFEKYWPHGGDKLDPKAYMALGGEYASKGNYHLSFLYTFKAVRELIYPFHLSVSSRRSKPINELYHIIGDAKKLLSVLNEAIQLQPDLPPQLKSHIQFINHTFNPDHLQKMLAGKEDGYNIHLMLKRLENLARPVHTTADVTTLQHKNILQQLTSQEYQSEGLKTANAYNLLNLYQQLFKLDPNNEMLYSIAETTRSLVGHDRPLAARLILDLYMTFPGEGRITRFDSFKFHARFANHLFVLASLQSKNEVILFSLALLHTATAIKKSVLSSEKITVKELDKVKTLLNQIFSVLLETHRLPCLAKKFKALGSEIDTLVQTIHSIGFKHAGEQSFSLIEEIEAALPIYTLSDKPYFVEEETGNAPSSDVPEVLLDLNTLDCPSACKQVRRLITERQWILALKNLQNIEAHTRTLPQGNLDTEYNMQIIKKLRDEIFYQVDQKRYQKLVDEHLWFDAFRVLDYQETEANSVEDSMTQKEMLEGIYRQRKRLHDTIDAATFASWNQWNAFPSKKKPAAVFPKPMSRTSIQASIKELQLQARAHMTKKEWIPALETLQKIEMQASDDPQISQQMSSFLLSHRKHIHDRIDPATLGIWNRTHAQNFANQPPPQLPQKEHSYPLLAKIDRALHASEWVTAAHLLKELEGELEQGQIPPHLAGSMETTAKEKKGDLIRGVNWSFQELRFKKDPHEMVALFEQFSAHFPDNSDVSAHMMMMVQYSCIGDYPKSMLHLLIAFSRCLHYGLEEQEDDAICQFAFELLINLNEIIQKSTRWSAAFKGRMQQYTDSLTKEGLDEDKLDQTIQQFKQDIAQNKSAHNETPEEHLASVSTLAAFFNNPSPSLLSYDVQKDVQKGTINFCNEALKCTFNLNLLFMSAKTIQKWKKTASGQPHAYQLHPIAIASYFQARSRHGKHLTDMKNGSLCNALTIVFQEQYTQTRDWRWAIHAYLHQAMALGLIIEFADDRETDSAKHVWDIKRTMLNQLFSELVRTIPNKTLVSQMTALHQHILACHPMNLDSSYYHPELAQPLYESLHACDQFLLENYPILDNPVEESKS